MTTDQVASRRHRRRDPNRIRCADVSRLLERVMDLCFGPITLASLSPRRIGPRATISAVRAAIAARSRVQGTQPVSWLLTCIFVCPGRGSNPHSPFGEEGFKTSQSRPAGPTESVWPAHVRRPRPSSPSDPSILVTYRRIPCRNRAASEVSPRSHDGENLVDRGRPIAVDESDAIPGRDLGDATDGYRSSDHG